ncbi:putative Ca2+/H+ antiporter (TMEM165/GDT1 family) [Natronospira proteinivora]|uniref:GDT1 family protein n=1 Tax=Natronospira proteinivora TaxID=1807133 RepID=A0ABT1G809_9GAMM|nr:TMEM165/GDT1 family protein [Natronospira proteinivora]MCP1727444.1 putative Ca2+/H+ antiporter (TMEM165/GDT1 family) [Natronospira proteinivora]
MEAFFLSLAAVSLAELGDRTQLLALLLAVKFRKPWAVLAGLGVASLAIHGLSAGVGMSLGQFVDDRILGWIVGVLFIGMGIWVLIPEPAHTDDRPRETGRGAFLTALITFFLMEIGDKTQLTSMAMAAHFEMIIPVLLGASLAMLLVNAPVIWLGHKFADRIPMRTVRVLAALLFIGIGAWVLGDAAFNS